ncbi:hypothetical protein C1701_16550 [Actinoalloteichus sp. AHMU CJ021]|nr:hypothetical protein C1701_16550 [Actinoalloteichus sp. AHMU CJ021]
MRGPSARPAGTGWPRFPSWSPSRWTAGELVGGLFSGNYPGGSGLTAGAVFGRLAGYAAAGESAQLRA